METIRFDVETADGKTLFQGCEADIDFFNGTPSCDVPNPSEYVRVAEGHCALVFRNGTAWYVGDLLHRSNLPQAKRFPHNTKEQAP